MAAVKSGVFVLVLILATALCGERVWAEGRKATLHLKDGRKLVGLVEEDSDSVTIELKYGTVRYKRAEVVFVEYADVAPVEPEVGAPVPAAGGAKPARSFADYEGRFILDPPEGWTIEPSRNPAFRVSMTHEDGSFMLVSVGPIVGDYPEPEAATKKQRSEIVARSKLEFATIFPGARGAPRGFTEGSLFDTPVFSAGYRASFGSMAQITEYRFALAGFEYVLRAGYPEQGSGKKDGRLTEAFESFSFVPPIEVTRDGYLDFELGFRVTLPGLGWGLSADVFRRERPLTMRAEDGEARVEVEILEESVSPSSVVGRLLKDLRMRRGGECTELFNQDGLRDGAQAVYRCVRGFEERGVKAKEFYLFVCRRPGGLLLIKGIGPTSGDKVALRRAELRNFFDGIRIYDAEVARAQLAKVGESNLTFSEGLELLRRRRYAEAADAFTRAIEVFPGFIEAYQRRSECWRGLKDYAALRLDLEKILEFDPDNTTLGAELAGSFYEEAKNFHRNRQFGQAVKMVRKAYRGDKKLKGITTDFVKFHKEAFRAGVKAKTVKSFSAGIKELQAGLAIIKSPEMESALADGYCDFAEFYRKAESLSKAKRMVDKAARVSSGNRRVAGLKRAIESAIEREKKQKKK
jgi:hypothetical protein